jgi:tRNA nucleotidyltransferase/poly(A) polymerase
MLQETSLERLQQIMADYIYLLENRLSKAQQSALEKIREIAASKGFTSFLVGGAVRDLTSGSPVRDLDVTVQGNALKLKKDIEKAGGKISGEVEPTQTLYVEFPGGVRIEVSSALSVTYPKPGKPVYKPATILDDLRRRDFTTNAMALSLNQGSYGLLMDPLNGVADIENRELRLVNPYGFIEDPVRMIRAIRFMARLGWQMDERTRSRYETGKEENYIAAMPAAQRGYETEEIFLEDDPLRIIKRLEAEDWVKHLNPLISSAKANTTELEKLRDVQMQLHIQGIFAQIAAASYPLLTAKMAPKDAVALKKSFARKGFAEEIDALEGQGKAFAAQLTSKEAAQPSQAWKLLYAARPEAVLWAAHHVKAAGLQNKLKAFNTEWPQARQKIPYTIMQEMRITPDLPGYEDLLEKLFFELMDGKLATEEAIKAFLEPYSPPAPPPPVHLRRARATRKDAKPAKSRKKAVVAEAAADGEEVPASTAAPAEKAPAAAKKADAKKAPVKQAAAPVPAKVAKAVKTAPPVPAKKAAAPAVKKAVAKPVAPVKKAPAKKAAPPKKAVKVVAKKAAAKPVAKKAAVTKKAAPVKKPVAKKAPAKPAPKKAVKPVAKKVVAKKKR